MTRGTVDVVQALLSNLQKGGRYLLAVSGGKDSMCLLHAACQIKRQRGLTLEVAHVNYNLRAESGSDLNFVREQASLCELPFHALEVTENAPAGENIENWARRIRYHFFEECIKEHHLNFTLTAHTAHDLAETLLMRLISNKEPAGIMHRDTKRSLIRPLLHVPLHKVMSYIEHNEIPYVQDHTNSQTDLLRNRVRHVLIPHLEQHFDERIAEVLSYRAESLHDDLEALNTFVARQKEHISSESWGSPAWTSSLVEILNKWGSEQALCWRLISMILAEKVGYVPGRAHSLRALEVIIGKSLACEIPNGWELRRKKGGSLLLTRDS